MGFMVLDELAGDARWRHASRFLWCVIQVHGKQVALVKPITWMNLSGVAVKEAISLFNGKLEDLLVVHDDMDLPLGTMKMRPGGGDGGHKGVHSVIYELGDEGFARIRIGIGHPQDQDVVDYVLQPFDPTEMEVVEKSIPGAALGVKSWVRLGVQRAMNTFNRTHKRSFPERDKGHEEV